jgi:hypothetical protein
LIFILVHPVALPSQQPFKMFILYILPLHVSALVGHLQVEYKMISGECSSEVHCVSGVVV